MTREEKALIIDELKSKFETSQFFYITDSSVLTVEQTNKLRRLCFDKGIELKVVKNTFVKTALESFPKDKNYAELYESLKGPTALMFTETSNTPAKLIKEFRKSHQKPVLKAAYIDSSVFVGDDQIDALSNLKTKEELVGEIIGLLQSPMKNVISGLKSGGNTIAGLVKALEERAQ